MAKLPGQTFTNGTSNYIFGCNTPDYNTALMTNTGVQAQLKSAGITVIRIPVEINQTNCTDAQLDAYATACQNVGAAMLCILRYSDLTFSKHVVQYLGSRCNLYEFSNEPDLNNVTWQQYLSAWNSLIPVLRGSSYNPNAAYIGPALGDIGNNESYLTSWLSGCVTSGVMPDAISFHIYPCTSNGVIPQATCLADAPNIGKTAGTLRTTVQGIAGKNLPICITEWNIDAFYGNNNHQSYSTNTPANAAFIDSFTQAAIDSMVQNAVDLACEFELNYYLVNDSSPSTPEAQLTEMAEEYVKYIGNSAPPDNPYGVTVDLDFVTNYKLPTSWITQAKTLGLGWIRIQISWHNIEPGGTGSYKWTLAQGVAVDETIQAINAAGLKAYFCVMNPPTAHKTINAGQGPNGTVYFPSPSDMTPFVTALVNRYYHGSPNGTLDCIEIGNEDFDGAQVSAYNAGYLADLLNTMYPLIKGVDPLMLVGPGAHLQVGYAWVKAWQTQLYTGGGVSQSGGVINAQTGLANMDFTNTHFYRGHAVDPENTGPNSCTIDQMHQYIHEIDVLYNNGNSPIWITEFGWPVGGDGVTVAVQSQYLLEVMTSAMNSGYCTHAFFYTLNTSDTESLITAGSPPVETLAFTNMQAFIQANPYWNSNAVILYVSENASGSELVTIITTAQLIATISEKQNETGTVSTILYGLRSTSINERGSPAETVIVTGINIFIVTVTLPPLARRDGQTPQTSRRDGAFPLDKRRDGQFPPDKRRG